MQAVVIAARGAVEVTTVDDPAPGPTDAVVEVAATGICGTDLHILAGEHGELPVIPGHELAGTVVAVGADTSSVRVGDRVGVDPTLPCHHCRNCRRGRTNLCETLGALGVSTAGGAAQFVAVPAASCVKLPDHVATVDAALIEPISCAVRAFDILRTQFDSRVLLYGAGTMGLLLLQLAQRAGVAGVDVVEVNAARLAVARQLGCTSASAAAPDGEWDVVIDATGNANAIADGLTRVAAGGTYLQFGVPSPATTASINPYDVYRREITITGSMAILDTYERAATLFAQGAIDPSVIITDRVPLADYADAIHNFANGHGLKTLVVPP